MNLIKIMHTYKKSIAQSIALSLLLQAGLHAAEMAQQPMGSSSCELSRKCGSCGKVRPKQKPKPRHQQTLTMGMPLKDTKGCGCGANRPKPGKKTSEVMPQEECTKGCPCANRPKPNRPNRPAKPKPKPTVQRTAPEEQPQVIKELVGAMVQDAASAHCAMSMPQAVRNCYMRSEKDALTPDDVLAAMPTLMRYALEQMDAAEKADAQKGEEYVEALMSYVEKHADMLKCHPVCNEVMVLMQRATDALKDHEAVAQRMMRAWRTIQDVMAEEKNPSQEDATRAGCCADSCGDTFSLTPGGEEVTLVVPGGHYCLASDDSVSNIRIGASDILLDLNGKTFRGTISVDPGLSNVSVKNGRIQPPAPTSNAEASNPAVYVQEGCEYTRLCCLIIECDNSVALEEGNGVNGRDGILNEGRLTSILDCTITTGAGASNNNDEMVGPFGDGGNGGNGIVSDGDIAQISGCLILTGSGGKGGDICMCAEAGLAGNGGSSGIGILLRASNNENELVADNTSIDDCWITTGNGGDGGSSCCANGGNGGNSGNGIDDSLQPVRGLSDKKNFTISNCTIRTGNAGNGGTGKDQDGSIGGNGGNSGNGIVTHGDQITNCLLSTGDAGNGATAGSGGIGGNAGQGILVADDACQAELRNNVVEKTGFGGLGGDALVGGANTGGNGGDGGNGILISATAQHSEARFSTISNTGLGGVGGAAVVLANAGDDGVAGLAILDENTDIDSTNPVCDFMVTNTNAKSAVFNNFAYAIGNPDHYELNNPNPNGVSVYSSPNYYDNVYMP